MFEEKESDKEKWSTETDRNKETVWVNILDSLK